MMWPRRPPTGCFRLDTPYRFQHEHEPPKTHRRKIAFADAYFDGSAVLAGVTARRRATAAEMAVELRDRTSIPVVVGNLKHWLDTSPWTVLIDARIRKRIPPESHCGLAALTIGLGPGHAAPRAADVVVETIWGDRLGTVLREGSALPLAGEPRAIEGIGREHLDKQLSGALRFADAMLCPDDVDFLDREQGIPHLKGLPCWINKLGASARTSGAV